MAILHFREVLHPSDHRRLARARDAKLPTQMRLKMRLERTLKRPIPKYVFISCGGKEDNLEDILITCERCESQAQSLCQVVEQCALAMPPVDAALFRESWRSRGVAWSVSLMAGIMPRDLQGAICVADLGDSNRTRSTSLALSMVELGDQAYARRN